VTLLDFQQNFTTAHFRPLPPEQVSCARPCAAIRRRPTASFFAYEGMIPPESVFNRENLERIVATAGA